MNKIIDNASQPPIAAIQLLKLTDTEFLSGKERTRLLEICAKEAEFVERKGHYSRNAVRARVKDQARLFAMNQGPEPTQSENAAESTATGIVRQLRAAYDTWFNKDARAFLVSLHKRLLSEAGKALAVLAKQHEKEAAILGLEYVKPPVVLSAEAGIAKLERDLARIADYPTVTPSMKPNVVRTFGLETLPK